MVTSQQARLPRHRRRGGPHQRTDQHVLFLTDGQPTTGDRNVAREMLLAEELGVAVHTIFIGNSHCPAVLDRLSERTGGSLLAAYFDVESGAIQASRYTCRYAYRCAYRHTSPTSTSRAAPFNCRSLLLQVVDRQRGGLNRSAAPEEQQRLDRMARVPALFKRYLDANHGPIAI